VINLIVSMVALSAFGLLILVITDVLFNIVHELVRVFAWTQ